MNNFLVAAFIVFTVSMFTFSAVFAMAIKLRLLPAQPKVTELIDQLFSFRSEHVHERILIATDTRVWSNQYKHHGLPLSVFSTAAAVATIFVVLTPMKTVEQRVTVRIQNGRENLNAARPYSDVMVPEVIVWDNREAA